MKRKYESPHMKVTPMKLRARMLQASAVGAKRSSYGDILNLDNSTGRDGYGDMFNLDNPVGRSSYDAGGDLQ